MDTSQPSMVAHAEHYAALIADDLGIKPGMRTSYRSIRELAVCHNTLVAEFNDIEFPVRGFCLYTSQYSGIAVSRWLSEPKKATVLLHELVHHLLHSERYEDWNEPHHREWPWSRKQFHEAICRAVERRFVEVGGFDVRGLFRKEASR